MHFYFPFHSISDPMSTMICITFYSNNYIKVYMYIHIGKYVLAQGNTHTFPQLTNGLLGGCGIRTRDHMLSQLFLTVGWLAGVRTRPSGIQTKIAHPMTGPFGSTSEPTTCIFKVWKHDLNAGVYTFLNQMCVCASWTLRLNVTKTKLSNAHSYAYSLECTA